LLFTLSFSGFAQWSLRTDVVVPIRSTLYADRYGIGTNVSAEFSVNPKGVFKLGFIHNTQVISDNLPDYTAEQSETSYDIIRKTGLRAGYKLYYKSQPVNVLPKGLFIATFADAMYGHRVLTKRVYTQENGYSENVPIDKNGIFLGGGISAGYTFIFGHFILEPNFGIGLCFNPKNFYNENSTSFFSELAPLPLHISVWHIELNLGWAF
jgi:hypothetical protein